MEWPNLINAFNALGLIGIVILGVYAAYANRALAKRSGGEGKFLHHLPPLFIAIDTSHPDCPEWVAREYRANLRFVSVCFILLLFSLYGLKRLVELFPWLAEKAI